MTKADGSSSKKDLYAGPNASLLCLVYSAQMS